MAIVADSAREAERIRDVYARRQDGGRYGWDQPGHLFDMQSLERAMLSALGRHDCLPLGGLRILEVGCGRGHFLRQLVTWGADPERVVGIDLLEDRLAVARRRAAQGLAVPAHPLSSGHHTTMTTQMIAADAMLLTTLSAGRMLASVTDLPSRGRPIHG